MKASIRLLLLFLYFGKVLLVWGRVRGADPTPQPNELALDSEPGPSRQNRSSKAFSKNSLNQQEPAAKIDSKPNGSTGVTTIYFTRHAERVNLLVETGPSPTAYDVSFPNGTNGEVAYTTPRADGVSVQTPIGHVFEEACGAHYCTAQLSDLGLLRADLLAEYFGGVEFDAIYASNKHRTLQTVAPTARRQGLDVLQLPSDARGDLDPESEDPTICPTVEAILASPLGSTLLVAGHSATLYQIMGSVGEEGFEDCPGLGLDLTDETLFPRDDIGRFPRTQYGDIWKVEIGPDGKARLVSRRNLQPTSLTEVQLWN